MNKHENGRSANLVVTPDTESFRLRRFVDTLCAGGDTEVIEDNVDVIDVASRLDGNPKGVLFRSVGAAKTELVVNVMGSRDRLALAFGTSTQGLFGEVNRRLERYPT